MGVMFVFSGAGRSCRGLCGRSRFTPRTATVTFRNAGGKIMRFGFISRSAVLYAEGGETRVSLRGLARSAQRRLIRARSSIGTFKQTGEFHISKCTENHPETRFRGPPGAPRKSCRHRPCSAPSSSPQLRSPGPGPGPGSSQVQSGSTGGSQRRQKPENGVPCSSMSSNLLAARTRGGWKTGSEPGGISLRLEGRRWGFRIMFVFSPAPAGVADLGRRLDSVLFRLAWTGMEWMRSWVDEWFSQSPPSIQILFFRPPNPEAASAPRAPRPQSCPRHTRSSPGPNRGRRFCTRRAGNIGAPADLLHDLRKGDRFEPQNDPVV
jgi:hypothetical protein